MICNQDRIGCLPWVNRSVHGPVNFFPESRLPFLQTCSIHQKTVQRPEPSIKDDFQKMEQAEFPIRTFRQENWTTFSDVPFGYFQNFLEMVNNYNLYEFHILILSNPDYLFLIADDVTFEFPILIPVCCNTAEGHWCQWVLQLRGGNLKISKRSWHLIIYKHTSFCNHSVIILSTFFPVSM